MLSSKGGSAVLRLEGICKTYRVEGGELAALTDVQLSVPRGELAAILGPSGSGKSTLMHILGCLDTPTAGSYWLDGRDVARLSPGELCRVRRESVGFVFQGYQLLPKLTAAENVAFPLMLRGVPEKRRLAQAEDALARVGLAERARHRPRQLSGGQQQRVAIARALISEPKLILADEPTGALDEASRADVLRLLCRLHEEGRTVVLITHDASVAAVARRRYRVEDGRVTPVG